MTIKAAFLDRDGVINIDHAYVHRPEEFQFIDGALQACRELVKAGFALIVVTNQSGIGRGYYSEADFEHLCQWMKEQFADAQAPITAIYYCPHHPTKALGSYRVDCTCRKPAPGMLLKAQADYDIDMSRSLMIGDKSSDMAAALADTEAPRENTPSGGKALSFRVSELAALCGRNECARLKRELDPGQWNRTLTFFLPEDTVR